MKSNNSMFIVRKHFLLPQGDFYKNDIYPYSILEPTKKIGMGDTLQEVILFLEEGGYIYVITNIHDLIKAKLLNKSG